MPTQHLLKVTDCTYTDGAAPVATSACSRYKSTGAAQSSASPLTCGRLRSYGDAQTICTARSLVPRTSTTEGPSRDLGEVASWLHFRVGLVSCGPGFSSSFLHRAKNVASCNLWSWFLFVIFTSCQKCGLLHQMRPAWGATSALPWWSPGPTSAPSPCLPGTLTRNLGHSLRYRTPVTGSPVTVERRPGRLPADCLVGAPAGCQQFWPPPGPENGVGRALTGAGRALTGASHAVTSLKAWELSASASCSIAASCSRIHQAPIGGCGCGAAAASSGRLEATTLCGSEPAALSPRHMIRAGVGGKYEPRVANMS